MKENGYRPDDQTSPGNALADWILANSVSITDVSRMTGLPHSTISDILTDRQRITPRIAHQLAALGHLDAGAWLQLQKHADERSGT